MQFFVLTMLIGWLCVVCSIAHLPSHRLLRSCWRVTCTHNVFIYTFIHSYIYIYVYTCVQFTLYTVHRIDVMSAVGTWKVMLVVLYKYYEMLMIVHERIKTNRDGAVSYKLLCCECALCSAWRARCLSWI